MAALYYWLLAITALRFRYAKSADFSRGIPKNTFAILIPAHNEEKKLRATLKALGELDYPKSKYRIFVVADNCTDSTAEIAREMDAECFERSDVKNQGKGYAIAFGLKYILEKRYDAIMFLDADCHINADALMIFDRYISQGCEILQGSDLASNPDHSSMSYTVAVGNFIENYLFYASKSRLGLAVFLRGTGMVFRREVMEQQPWKATSIAEDVEYTLDLLREGKRIVFAPEAKIWSEFPINNKQLKTQRIRWASGNIDLGKKRILGLMKEGFIRKKLILVDAGLTMLVISRPLVLIVLALSLMIATASFLAWPDPFSRFLLLAGIVTAISQVIYVGLGIVLFGLNTLRLKLLAGLPFEILQLTVLSILGAIGASKNKEKWERTPRESI
jgi:cellulose synthase/poly-beta-1,6-N-acetylglucosamine synthase-like glycosyltransferase